MRFNCGKALGKMPMLKNSCRGPNTSLILIRVLALTLATLLYGSVFLVTQEGVNQNAPVVKKVEPPSWWIGLTPDLMLLLSCKNLDATHVACNLKDVIVSRTQSTAGGAYLFIWL